MRCASLGRIPVVLACSRKFGSVARSSSRRKPWRRESIRASSWTCSPTTSSMPKSVATRQIRRCRAWQSASYLLHARHVTVPHCGILGALERGACSVAHVGAKAFLNHERVVRSFEAWALRGSERPGSDYMSMAYVTDSAFPADELSPGREMLFEGFSFPVPARAESYLERVYGSSWRELPPIEARRNHAPIELDFGSD